MSIYWWIHGNPLFLTILPSDSLFKSSEISDFIPLPHPPDQPAVFSTCSLPKFGQQLPRIIEPLNSQSQRICSRPFQNVPLVPLKMPWVSFSLFPFPLSLSFFLFPLFSSFFPRPLRTLFSFFSLFLFLILNLSLKSSLLEFFLVNKGFLPCFPVFFFIEKEKKIRKRVPYTVGSWTQLQMQKQPQEKNPCGCQTVDKVGAGIVSSTTFLHIAILLPKILKNQRILVF